MQQNSEEQCIPLQPHRYPFVINLFFIVILIAIGYSLYDLPLYIKAGTLFNQGKSAYYNAHYSEAIDSFGKSLKLIPDSKNLKIQIAKAYFQEGGQENEEAALGYLEGFTLSKYEYAEIKSVMPTKYESMFKSTKES